MLLDQDKLLQLLNQPGVKSGTDLGDALGVSRMAVQKRIHSLSENGLPIAAVPGKGYSLAPDIHLLSEYELRAGLDPEMLESLELFQSIPSTNSHLLEQSIELRKARVCISESQSAGRGRRGNDWQSAPYRNVMLSISWGFDHWPETITGLGLAVAMVIAERLNQDYSLGVKIKWPNDLLVADDKLAGILIDVAGESSGACNVVIGVGLNVHQPDWSDSTSGYRWQDLYGLGVKLNRNKLIAKLVNDLTSMLVGFEAQGFKPLVERWNSLSSFAGANIRVGDDESFVTGVMQGVDTTGALLLLNSKGEVQRFADSNVSVRKI